MTWGSAKAPSSTKDGRNNVCEVLSAADTHPAAKHIQQARNAGVKRGRCSSAAEEECLHPALWVDVMDELALLLCGPQGLWGGGLGEGHTHFTQLATSPGRTVQSQLSVLG